MSDLIRSHHITSNHIRSNPIRSHHITSNHIRSHPITSHHIKSHQITSDHITSHLITSYHHHTVYHQNHLRSNLIILYLIKFSLLAVLVENRRWCFAPLGLWIWVKVTHTTRLGLGKPKQEIVQKGFVAGPFDSPPLEQFRVNPSWWKRKRAKWDQY